MRARSGRECALDCEPTLAFVNSIGQILRSDSEASLRFFGCIASVCRRIHIAVSFPFFGHIGLCLVESAK
jgi:hypothetical protein